MNEQNDCRPSGYHHTDPSDPVDLGSTVAVIYGCICLLFLAAGAAYTMYRIFS